MCGKANKTVNGHQYFLGVIATDTPVPCETYAKENNLLNNE